MQRPSRRQVLATLSTATVGGVAGCAESSEEATTQATLSPTASYGYTHVQPTGNRVLGGVGDVRAVDPVEITLDQRPAWLLAFPGESGSFWTLVGSEGTARTVAVRDGEATTIQEYEPLPAAMPPLGRRTDDGVGLVRPPSDAAPRTHPVVTDHGLLYIAANGDLVLNGDAEKRFQVDALRDGRLVHVEGSRYALLGDRTTRYKHAALGGSEEGGSLVVFDAADGRVIARTRVGPPQVIEGIAPLVADLDGDGQREIVVTIADSTDGARIAVYDTDGSHVATGPIYGPGWRHQLCVAPFATDGTHELAVTRKPHVDKVVEFYRLTEGELTIRAEIPNVSTHTYGSVNTDGAVAADLDGDGQVELLVPNRRRDTLLAIHRTESGAAVDWTYLLSGVVETNLTGVSLPDGRVAVGVGTSQGVRVWQG